MFYLITHGSFQEVRGGGGGGERERELKTSSEFRKGCFNTNGIAISTYINSNTHSFIFFFLPSVTQ